MDDKIYFVHATAELTAGIVNTIVNQLPEKSCFVERDATLSTLGRIRSDLPKHLGEVITIVTDSSIHTVTLTRELLNGICEAGSEIKYK